MRVFEIDAGNQRLIETLRQHEGPVWQVAWSHPRLGSYLASCSYDSQVIIWAEFNGRWEAVCYHRVHEASGKPAGRTRKEGDGPAAPRADRRPPRLAWTRSTPQ